MGIKTLPQPPYSPDVAPSDFWLFPQLRGCRYETIEEMNEALMKFTDTLTQEDINGTFQKSLERYSKCITAGRDYFEGDLSFICVLSIKVPLRKSLQTYRMPLVATKTDKKPTKSSQRKKKQLTKFNIFSSVLNIIRYAWLSTSGWFLFLSPGLLWYCTVVTIDKLTKKSTKSYKKQIIKPIKDYKKLAKISYKYEVHTIKFETFFRMGIWNCRRLLKIHYVIAIHLIRWL